MSDERDVVEQLRDTPMTYLCREAADEIERLRHSVASWKLGYDVLKDDCAEAFGENERLREALAEIEKLWWMDGTADEGCEAMWMIAKNALGIDSGG